MHKNRKLHKDEMYALVQKWESSGQSQLKFLEHSGISKSTFGYWRKRYLENHGPSKPASGKLIPITVSSDKKPSISESQSLEIIYPNGVRLLCPAGMNLASIKELIV
jgi:hypothetical protein